MMGIKSFTHSQAEVLPYVLCVPPCAHMCNLLLVSCEKNKCHSFPRRMASNISWPLASCIPFCCNRRNSSWSRCAWSAKGFKTFGDHGNSWGWAGMGKWLQAWATRWKFSLLNLDTKRFSPKKSWRPRSNDPNPPVLAEWPASDAETQIFASQIGWPGRSAVVIIFSELSMVPFKATNFKISTEKISARISQVHIS
jgi:hypothetical protein